MQEDNSMVERILVDLENIIAYDDNLKQFDIVPVTENNKNKSPVLYEEHSVGLEMWCVKHVYSYIHSYLLKIRKQLKKSLCQSDTERVNRLLLGAVLIQPEVTTFWNMRKDLLEMNLIKADKELLLTKLVLSYKSKSNEAFAHRKWIIKRLLKNVHNAEALLDEEFSIATMACRKAGNNYHAWSYKIWLIESIPDTFLKSAVIKREFTSSFDWIFRTVSEHSGFHYRQRLLFLLRQLAPTDSYFKDFKQFVVNYLHIVHNSTESLLLHLLGETPIKSGDFPVCNLCVLLFELLYTCRELNNSYPGHESIWYHRRFVVYTLLETLYRHFNSQWVQDVKITEINLSKNTNIIKASLSDLAADRNLRENGEKHPKLFKSESRTAENTVLYKLLIRTETDFVNNISSTSNVEVNLAKRHENWLKHVMQISVCS